MSTYTTPSGFVGHTIERNVQVVNSPATLVPDDNTVFPDPESNVPDVAFLKKHFFDEGKLTEDQVLRLVGEGIEIMSKEPNLLTLPAPITIVGDIHGQYYDLIKMFQVAGAEPPEERFLFLGDYVDRGYFSVECFLYLVALKIAYPDKIFLMRGNHECRRLTKHFTFRLECNYKYSITVYDRIMEAFDALPLAAVVNNQFFCVHGGISPEMSSPDAVNKINRFRDPPSEGLYCDLMWSDPTKNYGKEYGHELFVNNPARGCSYQYTFKAVKEFLTRNQLLCVIRGHEAQDNGYRMYEKMPESDFPSLMTVFSAPNYVDVYKNKAAIIKYDGNTFNIRQFTHAPHPFYLPKFIDAFDWSLPFLSEKIADMLLLTLHIPNFQSKLSTLTPAEKERLEQLKKSRERVIKNKILAVNKISKMFRTVRNNREVVDELMNVMGTRIVPHRYLTLGAQEIRDLVQTFTDARKSDCINEMLPPPEEELEEKFDEAGSITPIIEPEQPPIEISDPPSKRERVG